MKNHHVQSEELNKIMESDGIAYNKICTSNWICKNAETKQFHQEIDSSYTLIAVPQWEEKSKKNIGNANFIFRWTDDTKTNTQKYLSIGMDSGVSLLFSGLLLLCVRLCKRRF